MEKHFSAFLESPIGGEPPTDTFCTVRSERGKVALGIATGGFTMIQALSTADARRIAHAMMTASVLADVAAEVAS